MHSDPIADLLARLSNGARASKLTVDVPHSGIKLAIVELLEREGYIEKHEITTDTKFPNIRIHLRYDARRRPLISMVRRVSKPGLRIYKSVDEIPPIRNGLTTRIVSTSRGLMTDRDARRRRLGGEIICEVA
ncbi:MAG: 30S ribosomal protein S8 [Armatimonadota bacterium]